MYSYWRLLKPYTHKIWLLCLTHMPYYMPVVLKCLIIWCWFWVIYVVFAICGWVGERCNSNCCSCELGTEWRNWVSKQNIFVKIRTTFWCESKGMEVIRRFFWKCCFWYGDRHSCFSPSFPPDLVLLLEQGVLQLHLFRPLPEAVFMQVSLLKGTLLR